MIAALRADSMIAQFPDPTRRANSYSLASATAIHDKVTVFRVELVAVKSLGAGAAGQMDVV